MRIEKPVDIKRKIKKSFLNVFSSMALLKAKSHKYFKKLWIGGKLRYFYTRGDYTKYLAEIRTVKEKKDIKERGYYKKVYEKDLDNKVITIDFKDRESYDKYMVNPEKYKMDYVYSKMEALPKKRKLTVGKETKKDLAGREGYINEKPSNIKNIGEDMLGAVRHRFDTYDINQLEESGMAEKAITKKNLIGDFQLDREERNKKGDTDGKVLYVYKIKELLKSSPPDDSKLREVYSEFIKFISIADTNSNTSEEFYTQLRNLTKFKSSYDIVRDYGEEYSKAKEIVELNKKALGMQLNKFFIQQGIPYSIRDMDSDPDKAKEYDMYNTVRAELGITIKGEVKIKKGDTVSIKGDVDIKKMIVDSEKIRKNYEELKRIENNLRAIAKKRVFGEAYNTLYKKYNSLRMSEITLGNVGVVEKVSKGRYQVNVKGSDGKDYIRPINRASIELEHSIEKGNRNRKPDPKLFLEGRVERTGGKEFIGTAKELQKQLSKDFRFKGLQYGNSMSDDEREYHTKWTIQSFSDLSDILGISVDKITLNNRLGIAFGARGHGNALAHYEPSTKIINLTASNGFGSLAHEWGHFLDNVVSNISKNDKGAGMASCGSIKEEGRTFEKYDDIPDGAIIEINKMRFYYDKSSKSNYNLKRLKAGETYPSDINKSGVYLPEYSLPKAKIFVTEEATVGGRMKTLANKLYNRMQKQLDSYPPYWSRKEEIFARAFETYVADKLQNTGVKNTYLASIEKTQKLGASDVYPQGELRKESNNDFDEIFKLLSSSDILQKALKFFINKKIMLSRVEKPTEFKKIKLSKMDKEYMKSLAVIKRDILSATMLKNG